MNQNQDRSSLSKHVSLRPIERSDLDQLRLWRNDERIYSWCRQFEPISKDHHERWFESIQGSPAIRMYVVIDEGRAPVGVCGLTSIDHVNSRAEFSLYIDPDRARKGFGEAALRTLYEHAFNVLNLNCVWGEAFEGNPAMRMFERAGLVREGIRQDFYYRNGKYIDAVLFSITKDMYVSKRASTHDHILHSSFSSDHLPADMQDGFKPTGTDGPYSWRKHYENAKLDALCEVVGEAPAQSE